MAEQMTAKLNWLEDAAFTATSGSGHSVTMDGPADHGGKNQGPRPMETLLMGVGGCASFDVVDILRRGRSKVTHCETELKAERADSVPAVFTAIHLHFRLRGEDLQHARVARAVELSATKYCSASMMLGKGGVEVSHSFEILDE